LDQSGNLNQLLDRLAETKVYNSDNSIFSPQQQQIHAVIHHYKGYRHDSAKVWDSQGQLLSNDISQYNTEAAGSK